METLEDHLAIKSRNRHSVSRISHKNIDVDSLSLKSDEFQSSYARPSVFHEERVRAKKNFDNAIIQEAFFYRKGFLVFY
jgi:hypothetical protein